MEKLQLNNNAFQTIFQWAIRSQLIVGFDFSSLRNARTRATALKYMSITNPVHSLEVGYENSFQKQFITYLPDNNLQSLSVKPFTVALRSLLSNKQLMTEENISLPHASNVYSHERYPPSEFYSELNHGAWWSKSWKDKCDPSRNEILVPIILYMDGISLDQRGRLNLTPLNMTLGIFNIETRKRFDAWETLYFHPDSSLLENRQSTTTMPIHKVINLHNGIRVALRSFKEACEDVDGYYFDSFPYNGSNHPVRMRFAIAYVIGDTEQHDKLCGKFQSRNSNVRFLCKLSLCLPNPSYILNTFV